MRPRFIFGCRQTAAYVLLISLVYKRAGFGNAALYECGLDSKLLIGAQVHHVVKGQLTRQRDPYAMLSWRKEHRLAWPIKFLHVPGELIIDEDCCPRWGGGDFQLPRGRRW
jgi:hypothetical protein